VVVLILAVLAAAGGLLASRGSFLRRGTTKDKAANQGNDGRNRPRRRP